MQDDEMVEEQPEIDVLEESILPEEVNDVPLDDPTLEMNSPELSDEIPEDPLSDELSNL